MLTVIFILCQAAMLASALVAGVFLAFSDFVMRSLNGASGVAGIQVMQTINREVMRSVFMVLFLGTAALAPLLLAGAWAFTSGAALFWIVSGAAVYFVGVFIVTAARNVPMNTALAAKPEASADAARYWSERYFPHWTFWNSFRTLASGLAALCFFFACLALGGSL